MYFIYAVYVPSLKIQGRIQTMWKLWFHKIKSCLIYIKSGNV